MRDKLIKHLKRTHTKFNKPLEQVLSEKSINNIADSLIATTPKNHCVSCGANIPEESCSHLCKSCLSIIKGEE